MSYKLTQITQCSEHREYDLGTVADLTEATEVVERLDAEFDAWMKEGHPHRDPADPVSHYEGCDIQAVNLDTGVVYNYEDDSWQVF